ncbi:MAG TPA: class I SAM-dependent methyltransferase [Pirellulales bacterium]|nr:class I SAM-dependent methyltransferase [Pirellulales bacterium]
MNQRDREAYRARYVERLERFGHDPRTLGWASGKQAERFAVLTSFVSLDEARSILDVGCGFGDLYDFLLRAGYRGRYTGLDLVPELIEAGRAAYPAADLRVADLAELGSDERFDLVVASGIFNAKLSHEPSWNHMTVTLARMFALCEVAAATDFLTSYVDFERADLHYVSPEQTFRFAKGLTRRVILAHHYMPFEFAICLYKDDRVVGPAMFPAWPARASLRSGAREHFRAD